MAKKVNEETKNVENVENNNVEVVEKKREEIICVPKITPEMAEMLLQGNFEHIRKHFNLTQFNRAKTKENRQKLMKSYKALIDSMAYMTELL